MRFSQILVLSTILAMPLASGVRAADADPRLPNDSELVLSLNVEQVLNSPLGKKYLRAAFEQALKDNPQGSDVLKAIELDPLKDVSRVTLSLWGKDNVLVIVSGKFNRDKIAELAAKAAAEQPEKVKIHKGEGATIYEMIDDNKSTFSAFADSSTILLSSDKSVLKEMLDGSSGKAGKVKKELAALIAKADAKKSIWLAALPTVASAIPLPGDNPQQKQAVDSLDAITGNLNVDNNVKLTLALTSKTAAAAQAMNKQLIDFVNLGKLFLPGAAKDKPEIAPVLEVVNTIRTQPKDKTVTITAEMTGDQIEKVIKSATKQ